MLSRKASLHPTARPSQKQRKRPQSLAHDYFVRPLCVESSPSPGERRGDSWRVIFDPGLIFKPVTVSSISAKQKGPASFCFSRLQTQAPPAWLLRLPKMKERLSPWQPGSFFFFNATGEILVRETRELTYNKRLAACPIICG